MNWLIGSNVPNSPQQPISGRSSAPTIPSPDQAPPPSDALPPQSFANQLQSHVNMSGQQFTQPPNIIVPNQNVTQLSPPSPTQTAKLTQFKVKPASALMPDTDKQKSQQQPQQNGPNLQKPGSLFKKKNRKSPSPADGVFGLEPSSREEVQSPAYSDISDDGAPVVMDGEVDKAKNADKKNENAQALNHMGQYGIYPYFSQPHQYVVPNQGQQPMEATNKQKETEKAPEKVRF